MFFHKYAWRLAILLPIFYTRNWRQIINGSADAQTNLLRVVDEDVIKNGLRGNHAFPSTHEVISQAFNHGVVYHDVIANSPTIQRLRISGTINSVAPYDVMNYNIARIASDFNCKVPLHDLIQNNPVAYMISPTGNKATFQVDDAKIDALVKQLTDDFTKPWATLENHYRIGSAMDSYICTEIINPVKNV
jgi:hypothetical protein